MKPRTSNQSATAGIVDRLRGQGGAGAPPHPPPPPTPHRVACFFGGSPSGSRNAGSWTCPSDLGIELYKSLLNRKTSMNPHKSATPNYLRAREPRPVNALNCIYLTVKS